MLDDRGEVVSKRKVRVSRPELVERTKEGVRTNNEQGARERASLEDTSQSNIKEVEVAQGSRAKHSALLYKSLK